MIGLDSVLGERWIKAGGGWRPRMAALLADWPTPVTVTDEGDWSDGRPAYYGEHGEPTLLCDGAIPDFRSGATRGAALDVVRERRGCPEAFLFRDLSRWEVSAWIPNARGRMEAHTLGAGSTEAEALVSALEITVGRAPGSRPA